MGASVSLLAVLLYGMLRGGWLDALLAGIALGMYDNDKWYGDDPDGLYRKYADMRDHGMTVHEAVIQASRDRLRPILMTTFSIIAGLVPTAIAIGTVVGWMAWSTTSPRWRPGSGSASRSWRKCWWR